MAKRVRTIVTYIDDLSGEELPEGDGQTIQYSLDGKHYEIDLSNVRAEEFRSFFKPIIAKSRKADTSGRALPPTRPSAPRELPPVSTPNGVISRTEAQMRDRQFLKEIRAWARENGFPSQSDTGRLMMGVREAWNEAHPDRPAPVEGTLVK